MTRSATVTAEFVHEWELEREARLRKRFRWYAWTIIGLNGISIMAGIAMMVFATQFARFEVGVVSDSPFGDPVAEAEAKIRSTGWLILVISGLGVAIYLAALRYVKSHELPRDRMIEIVTWLILVGGTISFVSSGVSMLVMSQTSPPEFLRAAANTGNFAALGLQGGVGVLFTHVFASLFLPWTARESLRPIWPLFYANAVLVTIVAWDRPLIIALTVGAMPLFALPGTFIAWWKHSRFRDKVQNRALRKRYGDIKRELVDARRIHEDLFPDPIDSGPVLMRYAYQPMRQIGGDYLYARLHRDEDDTPDHLHLVLLDVTGHGITAALTVNRLHGEIDRQLALDPGRSPDTILAALNEYLHLTLASRSVYATALAVRVDIEAGELRWASAGHPPAFVRTVDARFHQLPPTTIVLGAVPPDAFERAEHRLPFGPGDTLLAYTDGAIETRDSRGRMLRIHGLEAMLASLAFPRERPEDLDACAEIARRLRDIRDRPTDDDTLLVQLTRPIVVPTPAPALAPVASRR